MGFAKTFDSCRLLRLVAAAMLALARPAVAADAVCLPENLSLATAPSPQTAPATVSGNAVVYLDASVSMQGFVRPDRGTQALYIDTVLGLRQALEQVAAQTVFNSFGSAIRLLDPTQLVAATQPGSYVCNQTDKSGCDTRLDMVLDAVAASDDDTLSVIATDLFLSDRDLIGSTFGTMRSSLQRVLHAGKSIGVMGISAGFNGVVYDLPGKTTQLTYKGKRPFFLLVMAKDDQRILKVKRTIEKEVLSNASPESYRFALFTVHPAYPVTAPSPLRIEPSSAILRAERLPKGPADLPLLVLRKEAGQFASHHSLAALQEPFTAPLDNFKLSHSLWMYSGSGVCSTAAWLPWQAGIVTLEAGGDDLVLGLDPMALKQLPPRKFLLRATVNAGSTGKSDQLTGWLHEWGFTDDKADAVVKQKPDMFPVLNLGQLADSLQSVIDDEFRPVTVADFLLAFRKDD